MLCVSLYHGDLYSSLWKSHLYLKTAHFFSVGHDQVGTIHQRIMPSNEQ